MKKIRVAVFVTLIALISTTVALAAGPTGAIFTTTPDGSIVNENVRYDSKLEVYLDVGPGPNAPQTAAGLDDGWYVFQVTDPSGKYLLSMDPSKCRVVEVVDGVIFRLVSPSEFGLGNTYEIPASRKNQDPTVVSCHIQDDPDGEAGKSGQHDTNTDVDHGDGGAIVVQLMPFGDTPNPGGVYKAWMEKYDTYLAKGGLLDYKPEALDGSAKKDCPDFCAERDPGFGPANTDTKTDNFKVKEPGKTPEPPEITVKKFHDKNFNGEFDEGLDEWIEGWYVSYTEPVGGGFGYTPFTVVAAVAGDYTFMEETPAGTKQTVSILDGNVLSLFPAAYPVVVVPVVADMSSWKNPQELHTVVYGNVGVGDVTACKVYDRNGNGYQDGDEPFIPDWKMELYSADVLVASSLTGEDGCVTFSNLLPGDYTVKEVMPNGDWFSSSPEFYSFTVESTLTGASLSGGSFEFEFTNYCECYADFDTKGYWHNKNGLEEITQADIDYVNSLDPYDNETYFWKFPFDGTWDAGTDTYFGTGAWAEISDFLADRVNTSPADVQLSQQLLAFIFNTRHRLDSPYATIWTGSEWVTAQSLIDEAIAALNSGDAARQIAIKDVLDAFNNNDAVRVIMYYPCEFSY